MIKLSNVNKKYGKLTVFENFSLDIEEGKITCILGESGSGKTTILNMLAKLTDYSGEIECPSCSYVFQTPNLFPNMTVKQNLLLVNKDSQLVDEYLRKFRLEEKANSYPSQLSGGQAQRVSLMRGLLYDKPLLLLDEPFSDLDIGLKFSLVESVKKYHKESSKTIVMVTHDIKEAIVLADRIIVLSNGKIVHDEKTINEKTEEKLLGLLMGFYKQNN